jgi:branched-chain amino acid transport system substrate-binding protein
MVLADAMARAGSPDPAIYLPHLAKADYAGIMGRISFEADGELKNPPMTLYIYRNGRRVPLE